MLHVDAWGYNRNGVTGSFGADAGPSIVARVAMAAFLIWMSKRGRTKVQPLAEADT